MSKSSSQLLPRGRGTAVWRQIEQVLLNDVVAGSLQPGDRLPSEAALVERFGVNRHTVRRAIAELGAQNVVNVFAGKGAFVAEAAARYRIDRRVRSLERLVRDGHDMQVRVLSCALRIADAAATSALRLGEGERALVIESLSTVDRRPAILARHSFPSARFPEFAKRFRKLKSLSRTLASYGVSSTRSSMVIAAQLASARDAELLELALPHPILTVESIYVDQNGRPVDHGIARYAGDRIGLEIAD